MKIKVVQQTNAPFHFIAPFAGNEYVLLLYHASKSVSATMRAQVCQEIAATACRYVVCAGKECEQWHDAVDTAFLEHYDYEIPVDKFFMTTWHKKDNLDNVIFFFLKCTAFENFTPRRFAIQILGGNATVQDSVITALAAESPTAKVEIRNC